MPEFRESLDAGVTCRRWNWRQARCTQLRDDTTTALLAARRLIAAPAATGDGQTRLGPS